MLEAFKKKSESAERLVGGYYVSDTSTLLGVVTCIAQQVPRLHNGYHWRYNFKLNGNVISAKKLSDYINEHHKGNVSEYARVGNYHLKQVNRYLAQDATIEDGVVSFKKILQGKK